MPRCVKSDYRETISDIMAEETEPLWIKWSHEHGFLTRYQAHGSPGNCSTSTPTPTSPKRRCSTTTSNPLVSKFASSAAHVKGEQLVGCRNRHLAREHFTETLGELK